MSLIFKRYVDDCICTAPLNQITNIIDSFNLQFTLKVEHNNKINFMDITVINNKGNLSTGWCTNNTDNTLRKDLF